MMARKATATLKANVEERALWQMTADRAGLVFSEWAREALNGYANVERINARQEEEARREADRLRRLSVPHLER